MGKASKKTAEVKEPKAKRATKPKGDYSTKPTYRQFIRRISVKHGLPTPNAEAAQILESSLKHLVDGLTQHCVTRLKPKAKLRPDTVHNAFAAYMVSNGVSTKSINHAATFVKGAMNKLKTTE